MDILFGGISVKPIIKNVLILALCFLFSGCFFFLGDGDDSHAEGDLVPGHDTGNSFLRDIHLEINKVRTNPSLYAREVLELRLTRYTGYLYRNDEGELVRTEEGKEAMKECIKVLEKTGKLDALEMSKGLCLATQFLANDQAISGNKGHTASDGSNVQERMRRYGTPIGSLDEICVYGCKNAKDIVIHLLVDDNVATRKHRKLILSPNFRSIGIGFSSKHIAPEGAVTVIDLAETYFSH